MNPIRKIFGIAILVVCCCSAVAQHVDKIINMGIYKSYYCFSLKDPLYVTYTLFKGGGDCDRRQFRFNNCGEQTAGASDYAHSGYEEGHLANAEDFAGNCTLDKETFCFFNCLPQTVKLNRGIWKTWETKIRALSQTQSLFIIAGGIYSNKSLKNEQNVGIPDSCYKIVLNSSSKQIIYCLIFPNDSSDQVHAIDLTSLKQKLGYPLVP